ncbi:DUF3592 domain-containing protein [Actinoplanes sp. NPDC049265]|uniref:DUF3592 domain-containing protein n=1 Tax=Actinoplanes sp. NPDC049265 TaxID=3363902 RepID=UPI00372366C5
MSPRVTMGIAIFLVLAAGMTWLAVTDWRADSALDSRGVVAEARLVEIRDGGKRHDLYVVEFTSADGSAHRSALWQPPAEPRPAVGDVLRVVYDPEDPTLVRDAR